MPPCVCQNEPGRANVENTAKALINDNGKECADYVLVDEHIKRYTYFARLSASSEQPGSEPFKGLLC